MESMRVKLFHILMLHCQILANMAQFHMVKIILHFSLQTFKSHKELKYSTFILIRVIFCSHFHFYCSFKKISGCRKLNSLYCDSHINSLQLFCSCVFTWILLLVYFILSVANVHERCLNEAFCSIALSNVISTNLPLILNIS